MSDTWAAIEQMIPTGCWVVRWPTGWQVWGMSDELIEIPLAKGDTLRGALVELSKTNTEPEDGPEPRSF